ncbi:hypothetical protein [Hyphomicrobium sulfonivorans]|uniref:hypothetical protein n=1 Tax=Hyphomicrobium sulfonivorans TaxID=121290 RepID=UPI00156D94FF|nr:hypothetical protein [Hyphomicrobium sulfonivorans]MBI1650119.1 hypothetical protein [Hyphomicrobium sulfonivorans]NSL73034.1 hypothetical protein [Hyphomicrobium sulfonivorans]
MKYIDARHDPNLFGPWFSGSSWGTWDVIAKAVFGEALTAAELKVFADLAGHNCAPTTQVDEVWIAGGRRGGKDVNAASLVAFLATVGAELLNFRMHLTRGERGVVQLLAVDRDQAKIAMGYLKAYFEQPLLAQTVLNMTADTIELNNGLSVEITTNDKRRVRGRTVVACVLDEVAHWLPSENSTNPDTEVYRALKPAMATIPNALLIGISSPYARRGLFWKKYQAHYGKPGRVLFLKAPTWTLNPTLPRDGDFLTEAFNDDPINAASEFGAEFRADVERFVNLEVVQACVSPGIFERARVANVKYQAFVDPAGGSGTDSMTLAIGHRDGETAVLDAVRERKPPFSPEAVVTEFAETLKAFGITRVTGDRYASEWPREQFRNHGIAYDVSQKTRSDLYRDMLPVLNSGKADLLDNAKLIAQIVSLERRVSRGGREIIDAPPGGHEDLCNAVAGVIEMCAVRRVFKGPTAVVGTWGRPSEYSDESEAPCPYVGRVDRY